MGCNSCAPGEGDHQSQMPQLGQPLGVTDKVTWYYLDGNGRGDPLMQMFEYHGQPHEKVTYSMPQWTALKAKGEGGEFGGGLPQVNFAADGQNVNMAQMAAILRSFGARYGYYDPANWRQSRLIDPIVETYSDVLNGMAKIIQAKADKDQLMKEFKTGVAAKFHSLLEKTLATHSGKFIVGDKVTIADFVLASHISNNLINEKNPCSTALQASLGSNPKFSAYMKTNLNEFKKWRFERP